MKSTFYPPTYTTIQNQIIRTLFVGLSILLPGLLFAQNENIYWTETSVDEIQSIQVRGTVPPFTSFGSIGTDPRVIIVDAPGLKIFYSTIGGTDDHYHADINATTNEALLYLDPGNTRGLAFNATHIFYPEAAALDIVYSLLRNGTSTVDTDIVYEVGANVNLRGLQVVGAKIYIADQSNEQFLIAKAVTPFTTAGSAATVGNGGGVDLIEYFDVVEIGAVGSPDTYIYWLDLDGADEGLVRRRIFPTLGAREVLYVEGTDTELSSDNIRSLTVDVFHNEVYIGQVDNILVGNLTGTASSLVEFATANTELVDMAIQLTVPLT